MNSVERRLGGGPPPGTPPTKPKVGKGVGFVRASHGSPDYSVPPDYGQTASARDGSPAEALQVLGRRALSGRTKRTLWRSFDRTTGDQDAVFSGSGQGPRGCRRLAMRVEGGALGAPFAMKVGARRHRILYDIYFNKSCLADVFRGHVCSD